MKETPLNLTTGSLLPGDLFCIKKIPDLTYTIAIFDPYDQIGRVIDRLTVSLVALVLEAERETHTYMIMSSAGTLGRVYLSGAAINGISETVSLVARSAAKIYST